ncbi:FixH family protein [uncultured Algimonas sp.]|uniref:FixH family protein n=1 Tax=uncultured Algimonas sp. TaxID=1547920 RepID=UPI00260B924B|nr:FixH family protein [uncultured Algimonas sp.]
MASEALHDEESRSGRELTGRHVLAILVGFFGIIIVSSIVFTTLAVISFRGEDVERSYRQGIDYNKTLAERAEQSSLGWKAAVNVTGETADHALIVKVTGPRGQTLYGLVYSGRLRHPVDSTLDQPLNFEVDGNGAARADLSGLHGQWTLLADAVSGDDRFHFTYDLDLR